MEPIFLTEIPEVKTLFLDEKNVIVWLSAYVDNDLPALFLTDQHGEQLSVATVNLAGYGIEPSVKGNTFIKNYSENSGILDVLVSNGVVSKPVDTVDIGHTNAHEVEILIKPGQ